MQADTERRGVVRYAVLDGGTAGKLAHERCTTKHSRTRDCERGRCFRALTAKRRGGTVTGRVQAKEERGWSDYECGRRRCSMSAVCFARSPTLTVACPSHAGMSGNNHWFDPRSGHGGRDSERRDERSGGRGWDGNGGGYDDGGRYRGGPGQHVGTRVTMQVGIVRSESDTRGQYGGRGSEYDGACGQRQGFFRCISLHLSADEHRCSSYRELVIEQLPLYSPLPPSPLNYR